jgi:hypothetical protein
VNATNGPGPSSPSAAGTHRDKPQIKLLGFPHHCTRHNFTFQVHVTDDGVIRRLLLFVNGRRAARQRPGQSEWSVRVRMPVQTVRRALPKGAKVKVTIEVEVRDDSGKKARLTKAFQICG